jgi:hypothetical protein
MSSNDPKAEAAERIRLAAKASAQVRSLCDDGLYRIRQTAMREGVLKYPHLMQENLLAAIGDLSKALGILMTTQWPREEDYEG